MNNMPAIKSSFALDWTECDEATAIKYATHLFHSITTMEGEALIEYIKENRVRGVEITAEQLKANKKTDKRKLTPRTLEMASLFDQHKPPLIDPMQDPENRKKLNTLAREQLKTKLLNDISLDLQICKIEGWPIKEYLVELKSLIDSLTPESK